MTLVLSKFNSESSICVCVCVFVYAFVGTVGVRLESWVMKVCVCVALKSLRQLMNGSLLGWRRSQRPPEDASSWRGTRTLRCSSRSPEPFFPRSLMTAPSDANIIHHDTPPGCWWSSWGGGGGSMQRVLSWVVLAWEQLLGLWFGLSDSESLFSSGSRHTSITCPPSPLCPPDPQHHAVTMHAWVWEVETCTVTRGRGGEEQPLFHPHVQLMSRNDLQYGHYCLIWDISSFRATFSSRELRSSLSN